ncbi:hypothetical protein HYV86_02095 [Candidatus Woesearchaeota archaeon]|nr:hypothetical protein [Candidatus Woesearchaeota archaeon]
MKQFLPILKTPAYLLVLFHAILSTFSFSFIPTLFKNVENPVFFLLTMYAVSTLAGVIFMLLARRFVLRRYVRIGLWLHGLNLLQVVLLPPHIALWVYSVVLGLIFVCYWIPFNTVFYGGAQKNTNASYSAIYFASYSLIAILIPPLAAFLLERVGYLAVFSVVALFYIVGSFWITKFIPEQTHTIVLHDVVTKFKGLKTISMMEGAAHYAKGVIIPVYTLIYITREQNFGFFLSYVALIAFFIALYLCYHSDRTQQRMKYLFFLLFGLAGSFVALAFVHTLTFWLIVVGVLTIFYDISVPLRLAVSMDVKKNDLDFWYSRELFLNIGRSIMLAVAAVLFYFGFSAVIFGLFAVMLMIYPFLLRYKFKELV